MCYIKHIENRGNRKGIRSTGSVRVIDELGRIVLPIEVRGAFGIGKEDAIEILTDKEEGYIVLKKALSKCMRCSSTDRLKEVRPGFYLCDSCISQLKRSE